jgi:hypothetical protein
MRSDIVPGAAFPDYELTDHTAKRRKLSELQGPHPMVLALSRGGFCPKDRRQAEGLVELHRELEVGYCRMVTISTDNITETNEYRSALDAHWTFLSDAGSYRPKGSRHRRIHRSAAQSNDSARDCPRARSGRLQDLQRLLVLRPAHSRRSPPGPTCGYQEMPAGLGHHNART